MAPFARLQRMPVARPAMRARRSSCSLRRSRSRRKPRDAFSEEQVDIAERTLEVDKTEELIQSLAPQQRLALVACYAGFRQGHAKLSTGNAYECYMEICRQRGDRALTQRRFATLSGTWISTAFIRGRVTSKGRYGKDPRGLGFATGRNGLEAVETGQSRPCGPLYNKDRRLASEAFDFLLGLSDYDFLQGVFRWALFGPYMAGFGRGAVASFLRLFSSSFFIVLLARQVRGRNPRDLASSWIWGHGTRSGTFIWRLGVFAAGWRPRLTTSR